jgi:hypothetical protein
MASMCKVLHCRERMEEMNLKLVLYKLIVIPIKSPGTEIDVCVPLAFHQVYTQAELDHAANPPKNSYNLEAGAEKGETKSKSGYKPTHGTVDDFFTQGETGLVNW